MIFGVSDIIRVRVGSYSPSQAAINTCHYVVASVTDGGVSDAELALYLDTSLHTAYKAVISQDGRYRGLSVQKIFPAPVSRAEIVTAHDGLGSVASEGLPGQVAGLVAAHTANAGRKERARLYLPFPAESSNESPGFPTAAYQTAALLVGDKLYTQLTVAGSAGSVVLNPIVWHRATNDYSLIRGHQVRAVWATQRRRGGFGRTNAPPF